MTIISGAGESALAATGAPEVQNFGFVDVEGAAEQNLAFEGYQGNDVLNGVLVSFTSSGEIDGQLQFGAVSLLFRGEAHRRTYLATPLSTSI